MIEWPKGDPAGFVEVIDERHLVRMKTPGGVVIIETTTRGESIRAATVPPGRLANAGGSWTSRLARRWSCSCRASDVSPSL